MHWVLTCLDLYETIAIKIVKDVLDVSENHWMSGEYVTIIKFID